MSSNSFSYERKSVIGLNQVGKDLVTKKVPNRLLLTYKGNLEEVSLLGDGIRYIKVKTIKVSEDVKEGGQLGYGGLIPTCTFF